MAKKFELIDEVVIRGTNPDWVLHFQRVKYLEDDEKGYRFVWNHKGKMLYIMNTFIPDTVMDFHSIYKQLKKK
jgi:hypothetical protein